MSGGGERSELVCYGGLARHVIAGALVKLISVSRGRSLTLR